MGNISSIISPIVDFSLYECPICYDTMTPPYFQCANGHVICNECLAKVTHCPTCKGAKPNIRNRMLENVAEPLLIKCEFPECNQKFFKQEAQVEHVKDCDLKSNSVSCQVEPCQWNGGISELIPHMFSQHSTTMLIVGQPARYPMYSYGSFSSVDIYSYDVYQFVVSFIRKPWDFWTRCYFIVQVVGTRKDAKKLSYSASISDNSTKILWESNVSSILQSKEEIIYKDECFSFSTQQAMKFAKNGDLNISFKIELK